VPTFYGCIGQIFCVGLIDICISQNIEIANTWIKCYEP
jgi:hypothetical protein